jgi:hypothetical protein
MRDPVIYRIKYHSHPHVGNKWCIYLSMTIPILSVTHSKVSLTLFALLSSKSEESCIIGSSKNLISTDLMSGNTQDLTSHTLSYPKENFMS